MNLDTKHNKMRLQIIRLILRGRKNGFLIKPDNIGFDNGKAKAWSLSKLPKNSKIWDVCPKHILSQINKQVEKFL
jgi:hypothetical protein